MNLKATLDDLGHTAVYEIQIRQGDLFHVGKIEMKGLDDAQISTLIDLLASIQVILSMIPACKPTRRR